MWRAWDTGIAEDEVRGKEEGGGREKCRLAFIQHRLGVHSPSPGARTVSVRGTVELAPVPRVVFGPRREGDKGLDSQEMYGMHMHTSRTSGASVCRAD